MEPLVVGTTFVHYRLDAVLGKGGMGIVYRAHDVRLHRSVAVKVLAPNRLDSESRARLRAEALALSSLNHPQVAALYDVGCEAGIDYLVMEYVPGDTVDRLISGGALCSPRVANLGAQLARGLAAAHAAGVIHRDIKPGNLRVTPAGVLKILDFGVAISPAAVFAGNTTGTGWGPLGALAGTLCYMAPERLQGAVADARTDIFSAGLVLYEMACGRPPFAHEQPIKLIESILYGRIAPPRQLNPAIDRGLELVILRAINPEPARRYSGASELAAALEPLALENGPGATRGHRKVTSLMKWASRLAGALL